jgi:serine/threonine-protein kinase RsbW
MPLSPEQRLLLRVDSRIETLPKVLAWFQQFDSPPLSHERWLQAQHGIVEGYTNAVKHAHAHLPSTTPIDLEVHRSEQRFCIRIWDRGPAYDFEQALRDLVITIDQPTFDPLIHERQWGIVVFIKLRREYGWEISYNRTRNQRNYLQIEYRATDSAPA